LAATGWLLEASIVLDWDDAMAIAVAVPTDFDKKLRRVRPLTFEELIILISYA
jgi:hypothetical protein